MAVLFRKRTITARPAVTPYLPGFGGFKVGRDRRARRPVGRPPPTLKLRRTRNGPDPTPELLVGRN